MAFERHGVHDGAVVVHCGVVQDGDFAGIGVDFHHGDVADVTHHGIEDAKVLALRMRQGGDRMIVNGSGLKAAIEIGRVGEIQAKETGLHRHVANADLAVGPLHGHGAVAQLQIALSGF